MKVFQFLVRYLLSEDFPERYLDQLCLEVANYLVNPIHGFILEPASGYRNDFAQLSNDQPLNQKVIGVSPFGC